MRTPLSTIERTFNSTITRMDLPFQIELSGNQLPQHSDKCIFPPSLLLLVLAIYHELPHPLVFRLCGVKTVHTGVVEFTAPEQTIIVPKDVYEELQGEDVRVEVADLPKSTFLKIKPYQFYPHITNWKYYLESFLSTKYTVLSKNQKIFFEDQVAGKTVEILVEDCNADFVVVVETNVVLDIVPLDNIMAAQQLEHSSNLAILENIPVLELEMTSELEPFTQGSLQRIYKIDLRKQENNFSILLECDSDVAIVDLVCGLDKFLTLESFQWCTMSKGSDNQSSKTIHFSLSSDQFQNVMNKPENRGQCWLYVVAFAWNQSTFVSLRLRADSSAVKHEEPLQIPNNSKNCLNCNKFIKISNFDLHEAVCYRNNKKCSCGTVFERTIPSLHWHCETCEDFGNNTLLKFKHEKFYHKGPYVCTACDNDTEFSSFMELVEKHKGVECAAKLHECRFCHLVLPQGEASYRDRFYGLTHHESECGNRTVECYKCHKSIRNKDLENHSQLHSLQDSKKITEDFLLCSNVNCINIVENSVATSNEMSLCQSCYGPLYSPLHDPDNVRLQNRLERKYVIQLTKGCDQAWCDNKECATANEKVDTKLAIQRVKEKLLSQVRFPSLPINAARTVTPKNRFWFCVNESVYRKKIHLEELKEEKRFPEPMIYKALSLRGVEGARLYLIETA